MSKKIKDLVLKNGIDILCNHEFLNTIQMGTLLLFPVFIDIILNHAKPKPTNVSITGHYKILMWLE